MYLIKNYNNNYTKDKSIADYAVNRANNGLYYDKGHERTTWADANTICTNQGWRLPTTNEALGWNSNGVTSHIGWTWTVSPYSDTHYVWNDKVVDDTSTAHYEPTYWWYGYYSTYYVRCVK